MEKYEYKAFESGQEVQCKVFVKKQFLQENHCEELIRFYNQVTEDKKANNIGFFDYRVIWYTHIPEKELARTIMKETRIKTIELIKEWYELSHDIYGDSIQLVSWPEGLGMPLHYDNRHPNKNELHGTPWREYAGVIYLNDNYDGGELILGSVTPPILLKPERGMLVVFGGGDGYLHGVRPAFKNTRYTMPCWFTADATKAESDISVY